MMIPGSAQTGVCRVATGLGNAGALQGKAWPRAGGDGSRAG